MSSRALLRIGLTVVLHGILVLQGVTSILAAGPINDDIESAATITGLPYTDIRDVTQATRATDDPVCSPVGPDPYTVWYSFTPSTDVVINANTFGSTYDTTLSIYTGSRGGLALLGCNDDAGGAQSQLFAAITANTTYYFMVGAYLEYTLELIGLLSHLEFHVTEATLDIEVMPNTRGSIIRNGVAVVSGLVSCSQDATINVSGQLNQVQRRSTIIGSFSTEVLCFASNGQAAWSAPVTSPSGKFAKGPAMLQIMATGTGVGALHGLSDSDQSPGNVALKR